MIRSTTKPLRLEGFEGLGLRAIMNMLRVITHWVHILMHMKHDSKGTARSSPRVFAGLTSAWTTFLS